ncbi:MAG: hypothetical protein ABI615_11985, partial [Chthoniobacterales bacterium]
MPTPKTSFEAPLWKSVEGEWRHIFGNYKDLGISMEWHDFDCDKTLDWSQSFHPGSLEICLNLSGCGSVNDGKTRKLINPQTVSYYFPDEDRVTADRHIGQRHRFLTLEISPEWLAKNSQGITKGLAPNTRHFLDGGRPQNDDKTTVLNSRLQSMMQDICNPPVPKISAPLWLESKALEIVSQTLFAPREDELFCVRQN